jgi:hypothetical protein
VAEIEADDIEITNRTLPIGWVSLAKWMSIGALGGVVMVTAATKLQAPRATHTEQREGDRGKAPPAAAASHGRSSTLNPEGPTKDVRSGSVFQPKGGDDRR